MKWKHQSQAMLYVVKFEKFSRNLSNRRERPLLRHSDKSPETKKMVRPNISWPQFVGWEQKRKTFPP